MRTGMDRTEPGLGRNGTGPVYPIPNYAFSLLIQDYEEREKAQTIRYESQKPKQQSIVILINNSTNHTKYTLTG